MRNQKQNSKRISMVMALAIGILMIAMPAHAATPTVAVVGTSVSGSDVNVTVKNFTILPQVRTVTVTAVVNGRTTSSSALVVLSPYQTSTVRAGFSGVIGVVGSIGLTDDSTPF